ncbi:hypothetical protein OAV10_01280, partial [Hyphomicrobiales bacterium]|nr:hypothetical protein [Hyphomicrobiales bacterium]
LQGHASDKTLWTTKIKREIGRGAKLNLSFDTFNLEIKTELLALFFLFYFSCLLNNIHVYNRSILNAT